VILLLSTSDTDLLSARASGAAWRPANPNRVTDLPVLLAEADVVVVRILGGRRYWEEGIDAVLAAGLPVVALGGEQAPDAEMMELSTVPAGVAAQAHTYLAQGGPENLAQLHAFLSDTVLLTGEGFAPPVELPELGDLDRTRRTRTARPSPSSTTAPSSSREHRLRRGPVRCDRGRRRAPLPVFCASLRQAEPALLRTLRAADAMVVTVLAAGGTKPAGASAGGDDEAWDVAELAALDVPILQGLCLTSSRDRLGGQRRRPLPARRRDPGRRARVRRAG
jgi:cobaltochelatase CobN